jgi:hypothetical protein
MNNQQISSMIAMAVKSALEAAKDAAADGPPVRKKPRHDIKTVMGEATSTDKTCYTGLLKLSIFRRAPALVYMMGEHILNSVCLFRPPLLQSDAEVRLICWVATSVVRYRFEDSRLCRR